MSFYLLGFLMGNPALFPSSLPPSSGTQYPVYPVRLVRTGDVWWLKRRIFNTSWILVSLGSRPTEHLYVAGNLPYFCLLLSVWSFSSCFLLLVSNSFDLIGSYSSSLKESSNSFLSIRLERSSSRFLKACMNIQDLISGTWDIVISLRIILHKENKLQNYISIHNTGGIF